MKRKSILPMVLLLVVSPFLLPQSFKGKGRIKGSIQYENGKPAATVQVHFVYLEEKTDPLTTMTDDQGEFAFLGLGSGEWRLIVQVEGYKPVRTDVTISQLRKNDPLNITLEESEESREVKEYRNLKQLLKNAEKLEKDEDYQGANDLYRKFLESNPDTYEVYYLMGKNYRHIGQYDKAVESLLQSIRRMPEKEKLKKDRAAIFSAIGEIYIEKEELEKAVEYFEKSIALYPGDEVVPYNVAEILFAKNQVGRAITFYQKALEIKPDWAECMIKLGYAYLSSGEMGPSIEILKRFLKEHPDHPRRQEVQEVIQSLE